MKLIVFQSSQGDCLLISHSSGNSDTHILVDGGLSGSFKKHTMPYLNKEILDKNQTIDLLCVSHIDQDHIKGVLTLMDELAKWRVYRFHDNKDLFKEPKTDEPPSIDSIWHNSFAKTYELGSHLPRVEQSLHDVHQLTLDSGIETIQNVNEKALSVQQGITLSQMIRPEKLNIKLNPQYNGNLVKVNSSTISKNVHKIGEMELTVIAPFPADIKKLKAD